jgi:hypothetical protein
LREIDVIFGVVIVDLACIEDKNRQTELSGVFVSHVGVDILIEDVIAARGGHG